MSLLTVPVPSLFVVSLKVVNFGVFLMEHLKCIIGLVRLGLAE